MPEPYTIRQLTPALLPELARLFREVFGAHHSIGYLRKKYDTPDLGASYLGFMGFDARNQPVGFCGGIPCLLGYKDLKIKGIQLCDAMTLPTWHGKGLWGVLANTLCELALAEGMLLHFGIVNADSLQASLKKLPWEVIGEMRRFTLPVRTLPLQKLGQRLPFAQKIQKQLLTQAISPFAPLDHVPNHLLEEGRLACIHDHTFFHHKLTAEHHLLDLPGGKVWLKAKRGLWLGDVLLGEPASLHQVMNDLRRIAFRSGIHQIQAQFTLGCRLEQLFSHNFGGHSSWKITGKSHDPRIPATALALTLGDMDTF